MRSAVRSSLVADHMLSKTRALDPSGPSVVHLEEFQPASSQHSSVPFLLQPLELDEHRWAPTVLLRCSL